MIAEGQMLPAFSIQDTEGRTVTPQGLKGRWTLIYAYPKDNTPGCTQEACDFRDAWERVASAGLQVYGLSRDSAKSHAGFAAKHALPFPLLSDPEASLLKALGAFGPKVMYGKTCEGIIRSSFLVDPEGQIRKVWPKVSVKGHVEQILTFFGALDTRS